MKRFIELTGLITFYFVLFFITADSLFSQVLLNKTGLFPDFTLPISYPAVSPDGKFMVFLTDDGIGKTAYESNSVNGQWAQPAPMKFINDIINSAGKTDVGGFSFNFDGSVLYFHSNIGGNYDIFYSINVNGSWTEPENFGAPVNTSSNEYSPSFSTNGKILILLRDKANLEKDKICKELVLYEMDKSGTWKGPLYMPTIFNKGCQETPYLCSDNLTLFFASERPDTNQLGKKVDDYGFNIYYTKRLFGNGWYIPAYVDELSTEFNDLSPSMEYTGEFFLSNIKADKLKNQPQDIYSSKLPEKLKPDKTLHLYGTITDLHSKKPLDAKIIVYNAITSVIEGEYSTTTNGQYSIILNYGINYKIDFCKDGFSHFYLYENTNNLRTYEKLEMNVNLYDEVKLDLNVFDNEMYYPLQSLITVTDSLAEGNTSFPAIEFSKGRYSCKLKIGKIYKISFETEYFKPFVSFFDLRTDVQYSHFEKDIELQADRKKVFLNIFDATTNEIIEADVLITNLVRDEQTSVFTRNDENGKLLTGLRYGDHYNIDVAKKGYTYFKTTYNVSNDAPGILDIGLNPLSSSTTLVFNNITFETNSADLNSDSFNELNRLALFIIDNNEIVVEISAHTDDIGSDTYNNNLSLKRAQEVVDYLVSRNVPFSRLRSRGYGKTVPLVPNNSDENRAKNRRVELKIIDNSTPIE